MVEESGIKIEGLRINILLLIIYYLYLIFKISFSDCQIWTDIYLKIKLKKGKFLRIILWSFLTHMFNEYLEALKLHLLV